jgi:hypothetical protein
MAGVALTQEEARVRAVADTVTALIQTVREGRDVDLNQLKGTMASNWGLKRWAWQFSLGHIISIATCMGRKPYMLDPCKVQST